MKSKIKKFVIRPIDTVWKTDRYNFILGICSFYGIWNTSCRTTLEAYGLASQWRYSSLVYRQMQNRKYIQKRG